MSEVVAVAGRELTLAEARAVEFPITADVSAWATGHRHRRSNPAFDASSPVVTRIGALQPVDEDAHPLRLLVEHTNLMKHRVPGIVAARQAAVTITDRITGKVKHDRSPRPIAVGDLLAAAEHESEVDSFTYVALERPHSGEPVVLLAEIATVEEWVRAIALPTLIAGVSQDPPLPSAVPVDLGHNDLRTAMVAAAGSLPAAVRGQQLAGAAIARAGLLDLLLPLARQGEVASIRRWVHSLDFDAVSSRLQRIQRGTERGEGTEVLLQVIRMAVRADVQGDARS